MEFMTKAKLEADMARVFEMNEQIKSMKNQVSTIMSQIQNVLEAHDLEHYAFVTNEISLRVEINLKSKNVLSKDKLAEELSVLPKDIKTKNLIRSAAEGKLSFELYEACHLTEVERILKFKKRKVKPPKPPKVSKKAKKN